VVSALVVVGMAPSARAQSAAAEAEFVKGKKLLGEGKTDEACAAFERSQQLEPLSGTLYNLALCYEEAGKTASAWLRFREVAQTDTNAARRKASTQRATALEKRLTKLLITVRVQIPGMRIMRNEDDVTKLVGIEDPVDPGRYHVVATAEGYEPAELNVDVHGQGTTITLEIPRMERSDEREERPKGEYEQDRGVGETASGDPGRGRRFIGMGIAGTGVVALGVGIVFGVKANSTWGDVEDLCPDLHCANQADYDRSKGLISDARRDGNVSTILIGAGAALAATGVYLWLTAPHATEMEEEEEEPEALRLVPQVGGDVTGIALTGGF